MTANWSPDTSNALVFGSWKSANNLSGYEGRAVKVSNNNVILASDTTSGVFVLADGGVASAVNVGVAINGLTQVKLGDNVTPLDWLTPKTTHKFTTTAIDSGQMYSVMALTSGADGDTIRAMVVPPWRF